MPITAARLAVCLVWLLAACTNSVQSLDFEDRPGLQFEPEGEIKAAIIAVHGFNDHSRAFEWFGEFAASNGYLVDAYDQQGFGRNPNWGHWPGQDALVADLIGRIDQHKTANPDRPLYVLGESMGGAVSMLALANHPAAGVDGLILSAPALWGGEAMNPFYRATLWLAARLIPNWTFTGKGLGIRASDNVPMLRELGADPLYIKDTRVQSMEGIVNIMGQARLTGPHLLLPILLLGGLHDEVIPPDAQDSFVPSLLSPNCRRIVYEEGWHLLLRDLQRQRVWDDIINWLDGTQTRRPGQPCRTGRG